VKATREGEEVSLNKRVGDGTAELGDLYPDPRTISEAEASEHGPNDTAIEEALERPPRVLRVRVATLPSLPHLAGSDWLG